MITTITVFEGLPLLFDQPERGLVPPRATRGCG